MTTLNAARAALETRLLALPGLASTDVAWPGITYPPAGQPFPTRWYKPALIPTQTMAGVGIGATTHPRGSYIVSIFRKPGPGAMVALHADAEALLSHFDRASLASGSVGCGVPEIGPALQEPDWLQLPVTIPFLCL